MKGWTTPFFIPKGGKCVACWTVGVGERIAWTRCPGCKVEWSKLLEESGLCWDCDEAATKGGRNKENHAIQRLVNILGSEKAVRELSLDAFHPVTGTETAYLAAKNFNPATENLYLWGPTGRGKTHLAYGIAQKALRAGLSAEVLSMRDFVNRFRMVRPEEEANEVKRLTRIDVLVIDDFGAVRSSDFSMDILLDVLNKRFLQEKNGLIITSNLFFEDLARKNNDDRITSRLAGACKAIEIRTDWDFRLERR